MIDPNNSVTEFLNEINNKVKLSDFISQYVQLTERGNSFGYDSLTSDMRSIQIMKEFGFPVIYDATHSAQIPGNFEETTSGAQVNNLITPLPASIICSIS